eukprot:4088225-Alexandrium_andersonii.AAC.1
MCAIEGRLGGGPSDLQEAKLLNRIIRWTPDGLLYGAGAEQLLGDLRKSERSSVRRISFPGCRRDAATEDAAEPLGPAAGLSFR